MTGEQKRANETRGQRTDTETNVSDGRGHRPVDDALSVQVLQAAADLCRVEDGSLLVETRFAHVIDVKLEVSSVHEGQHEAQSVLCLIGVR